MKIFLILYISIPLFVFSQKHDYIWITGHNNNLVDTSFGGATIDFNFNPAYVYYNYRELNLFTTNASICDSLGNLLFYTNGCSIAGADDLILENGEDLNPGSGHSLWCDQYKDGYSGGIQNAIILPLPDSIGVYYLIHKSFELSPKALADKLMYSVIDMRMSNGKGKVVQKNVLLMTGELSFGEIVGV